ncbi:lipopolysaccharide assembly protein LapA domain-containing protein [Sabulicella rubraurantiaca]|uniref:lipopolysaccharide assembly protein LapA domain-containing protein n=1 Tax=Sabulicella rubraurantiaca TaxID=2811429 RepID=UPI001A962056|nr:LapA family protein [Sabulicella rubraurantiaca]
MGIVVTLILAVLVAVFALGNPQAVDVNLWPRGWVAEMPLWQAILVPAALAFLAGALVASGAGLRHRRRLAQLEQASRLMEAELAARDKPRRA